MANEQAPPSASTLDMKSVLAELEVPFSPDQVQWRVTNTAKDKKRGQIVPYAGPRAYADRLNALFTPQGWTREYKVETMSNITRMKKGESIVSGKILMTCMVTIIGLWSHSGTGEEWADDENGMTSADPKTLEILLAKLQAPPLADIGDMKTLRNVVFGLEQLADSPPAHTALA